VSAFPTNDGLACISVQWPAAEAPAFRADVEANFLHTLNLAPELALRLADGTRRRPFVVTTDLPNFFRTSHGPGWALVGDAGRHRDPFLGQGIADAFHDAELLAEAIDAGLSGVRPLDEALADYERHRNEAALPNHQLTTHLAGRPHLPTEVAALLAAIQGDPARTSRFLGLLAGSVPVSDIFEVATKVSAAPSRP
jgi:2-polyprenyl-6-methoxyphenol hydroxylase-like FAD-dependent oxidoreductase